MGSIRVGVVGAGGKMGTAVCAAVAADPALQLVAAVDPHAVGQVREGVAIAAEPRALVGFAGPRVVQATVKAELPEGFQSSEFMLDHGFVDLIVPRGELRTEIARIIDYCTS